MGDVSVKTTVTLTADAVAFLRVVMGHFISSWDHSLPEETEHVRELIPTIRKACRRFDKVVVGISVQGRPATVILIFTRFWFFFPGHSFLGRNLVNLDTRWRSMAIAPTMIR